MPGTPVRSRRSRPRRRLVRRRRSTSAGTSPAAPGCRRSRGIGDCGRPTSPPRRCHVRRRRWSWGGSLQTEYLGLQLVADDRVDRAERLVHEQDVGIDRETARHPDALLLPAGELATGNGPRAPVSPTDIQQLEGVLASSRLAARRHQGTVAMLSITVKCGRAPTFCITYPMPSGAHPLRAQGIVLAVDLHAADVGSTRRLIMRIERRLSASPTSRPAR